MRIEKMHCVDSLNLLQGNFLVATPLLSDPIFDKSIVFVSEFKESSAYGFLVDYTLQDTALINNVKEEISNSIFEHSEIFFGGPMDHDYYFVIHSDDVVSKSTLRIANGICVTNLSDAISSFPHIPYFYKIVIGYCTWQCGQLSEEVKNGLWLTKSLDKNLLFINSKNKWQNCINSFDVNFKKFSLNNGMA